MYLTGMSPLLSFNHKKAALYFIIVFVSCALDILPSKVFALNVLALGTLYVKQD